MADENLEQNKPAEESKKDTVRINLPPGLTGRGGSGAGAPGAGAPPSPTAKPKAPGTPGSPEDEAKRETLVMARPAEAPKPKKDTSRVQVVAAKPITVGGARPTIKLQHEEEAPAAPEAAAAMPGGPSGKGAKPAARPAPDGAGAPSGAEAGLSLAAMVLSLAVVGYLAYIALG